MAELLGVPEPLRAGLGLAEQSVHAWASLALLQQECQAREEPRARPYVGVAERAERALEEPCALLVPSAEAQAGVAVGGVSHRVRVAQPLGHLHRLSEDRAREVAPPLLKVHPGQSAEQLAAPLQVGRRKALQQRECVLEVSASRLQGRDCPGAMAGPRRVVGRPGRVVGQVEVAGQVGEAVARVVAPERFQRLAHAAVEERARVAREVGLDRVAHQRVGEAIVGAARGLAHQVGALRLVERLGYEGVRRTAHSREPLARELAPQHRREGERLVALPREATEARPDHVGHARRHGRVLVLLGCGHQLAQQEGVAVAPREERVEARLLRLRAREVRDEGARIVAPEPLQPNARARLGARQLGQRLRERVVAVHLGIARGPYQEGPRSRQLAGHVGQERQRGGVSPLEVVEQQHQAPVPRRPPKAVRDGVEEAEARLLGLHRRAVRGLRR
jgi:hypothetical protein